MFVDAPAGHGKSQLLRTIACSVRLQNNIATICTSTGIAALEYKGGLTAHSLFKIPVLEEGAQQDNTEPIICGVGGRTQCA